MIINIMFSFIKFSNRTENSYDIRLPLNGLDKTVTEHNLHFKYVEKAYFLNNVVIKINSEGQSFKYENDITINVRDGYIIREYEVINCPAFSFQGHPEASPGPTETNYLFDNFIKLMIKAKKKQ